ncbi:MAG: phosphoribosylamine--glycine ligase N-terminal domain-containing protein [Eggerthellaceae bacterium]
MNVLVLGSGGREHALTWALVKSSHIGELYVAPARRHGDHRKKRPARYARRRSHYLSRDNDIELVVVGPEAPLVEGVAEKVRHAGFAVSGPMPRAR